MTSSGICTKRLFTVLAMGMVCAACDNPSSSSAMATPSASAMPSASAAPTPSASASAAPMMADAGNPDAEAAADQEVADELAAHQRHERAGFAGFVMSSVETLGTAPDQEKAIDGFRKEYKAKTKPLHEANEAVTTILADGIAANKIDHAKLDAAIAKSSAAATTVHGAMLTLLEQLHTALRPEQRNALVDKVDAHFAAWRDANDKKEEKKEEKKEDKMMAKPDRGVNHAVKEFGLSKDQADKFRAALDAEKEPKKPFDSKEVDAYIKAFDKEFASEKFDAKKLPAAGPGSAGLVTRGTEHMVAFYEALLPVLTPDQRTAVAAKLREKHDKNEKSDKKDEK